MPSTRRDFLKLGLSTALASVPVTGGIASTGEKSGNRLRILVLGGTGFIGPHFVRHALSRGHELTLFNRGRTNLHLFPQVEKLVGDRAKDVAALKGRRWDVVVDNSGYKSDWVERTAKLLSGAADHYLFTSTRSVYRDFSQSGITEDAPIGLKDVPESEWKGYGPEKAACERVLQREFQNAWTIIRPAVVVGPEDRSDRFTSWVARVNRGGEILAPGEPENPLQFIDVRDLAEWMLHILEQRITGIYNVEGPASKLSFAEFLYGLRAVTSSALSFTWVATDFLIAQGIKPYQDIELWMPAKGKYAGFQRIDNRKAIAAGLKFRPLARTAMDTLDWLKGLPRERQANLKAGLDPERERDLLNAWHASLKGKSG